MPTGLLSMDAGGEGIMRFVGFLNDERYVCNWANANYLKDEK